MKTTYETAQKTFDDAYTHFAAIQERERAARSKRDALKAELANLEQERKTLLADAAIYGVEAENIRAQHVNKERLDAAKGEFLEADEALSVFDEPMTAAADAVRHVHAELANVIRTQAKAELETVCDELKAVATPLIARALALCPAAQNWHPKAGTLLEELKLHRIDPAPRPYTLPLLPHEVEKRRAMPQPTPKRAESESQRKHEICQEVHLVPGAPKVVHMR